MGQSTSSATLTTLFKITDFYRTPNSSTSSAVVTDSLPHVVASEPGAPPAIMIGSVSAPLRDAPIVAVCLSCKRKQPNSILTLVAAKIPAAVRADGATNHATPMLYAKPSLKLTLHHDILFSHTYILLSYYLVIPCSLVSLHLYCTHCSILVTFT